jgi:hypothetical protein
MLGGAASLDTEHTEGSSLNSPPTGTARLAQTSSIQNSGTGPPLVARSRAPLVKCEVPIWLSDANGTVAAMGATLILPPQM